MPASRPPQTRGSLSSLRPHGCLGVDIGKMQKLRKGAVPPPKFAREQGWCRILRSRQPFVLWSIICAFW